MKQTDVEFVSSVAKWSANNFEVGVLIISQNLAFSASLAGRLSLIKSCMKAKSFGCLLGISMTADKIGYLGFPRKGMTMDMNVDFSKRATVHAASTPWVPSPVQGLKQRILDRMSDGVAIETIPVRCAP